MKKSKLSAILIPLIFLVAFNLIFFIVGGFDHPASVWIAYGVIHFSFIFFAITPLFVSSRKNSLSLGATLSALSLAHFAIEFIVSLIIIFIAPDEYKAIVVIYVVLFAIFFIAFFSMLAVNKDTERAEKRQRREVIYIKDCASRIKLLIGKIDDAELNKQMEKAYDALHASPTRSDPSVSVIEMTIQQRISELETAVRESRPQDAIKIATDILYLTENRTRMLQMSNY